MWCPESRHLMRKVPLACLRSSLLSATGWDVLPIGILSLPGSSARGVVGASFTARQAGLIAGSALLSTPGKELPRCDNGLPRMPWAILPWGNHGRVGE
jgi:hypothetical protein